MKNRIVFLIIFLLTISLNTKSQEWLVKGYVTTFDSIPLINAEIKVKSSKDVVTTDNLGYFEVNCLPDDKLKVSARGFNSRNVKLDGKIKLVMVNLVLNPSHRSKEVAVGYGHVSDKDKLYAISSIDNEDLDFSNFNNMYDLIRGRFPGVEVTINNEIIIRGINSLHGSSSALIVIDGVIVSDDVLKSLPTTEVKSIDILKDASASVYGSRGGNGVVIIQTKKRLD